MTSVSMNTAGPPNSNPDVAPPPPPPPAQPQPPTHSSPSSTSPTPRSSTSTTPRKIAIIDNTTTPYTPPRSQSPDHNDSSIHRAASALKNREEGEGRREVLRKAIAERRYKKWSNREYGSGGEDTTTDEEPEQEHGNKKRLEQPPPDDRADGVVVGRNEETEEAQVDDGPEGMKEIERDFQKPDPVTGKTKGGKNPGEGPSQGIGQRVRRKGPGGKEVVEVAEIDVLYENQRGWFLCGTPYFSSRSLLNFDPSPWQNHLFHPSAVSITNYQLPDPSWTWAWKSWYVDMTTDVDEEGWSYSFSFSPAFAWHGNHVWFHSWVRRRRWLRKRVKLPERLQKLRGVVGPGEEDGMGRGGIGGLGGHIGLGADYFTIHDDGAGSYYADPRRKSGNKRRSKSKGKKKAEDEATITAYGGDAAESSEDEDARDIDNVPMLLHVIKRARLDREKIEAVQNFLEHGGEELRYLPTELPKFMSQLMFQASRRHLCTIFSKELEKTSDPTKAENLGKLLETADGELKKLEFWSDKNKAEVDVDTTSITDPEAESVRSGKGKQRMP